VAHYSGTPGARGPGSLNRLNPRFLRHWLVRSIKEITVCDLTHLPHLAHLPNRSNRPVHSAGCVVFIAAAVPSQQRQQQQQYQRPYGWAGSDGKPTLPLWAYDIRLAGYSPASLSLSLSLSHAVQFPGRSYWAPVSLSVSFFLRNASAATRRAAYILDLMDMLAM